MESQLLEIYNKIKNKELYSLPNVIYYQIYDKDSEIKWYIKNFAYYHKKFYKNNNCEVYNTNIILEILRFLDIYTCIYVENFNYVTLIQSMANEGYCFYFDYEFSEKMFNHIIKLCEKKIFRI